MRSASAAGHRLSATAKVKGGRESESDNTPAADNVIAKGIEDGEGVPTEREASASVAAWVGVSVDIEPALAGVSDGIGLMLEDGHALEETVVYDELDGVTNAGGAALDVRVLVNERVAADDLVTLIDDVALDERVAADDLVILVDDVALDERVDVRLDDTDAECVNVLVTDVVRVGELVSVGDHEGVDDAVRESELVMVIEDEAGAITTRRINEELESGCIIMPEIYW